MSSAANFWWQFDRLLQLTVLIFLQSSIFFSYVQCNYYGVFLIYIIYVTHRAS